MRTNITRVFGGIAHGALGHARHMAVNTGHHFLHDLGRLILHLVVVAVLAHGSSCLSLCLTKLDHAGVRVMAVNTFQGHVFGLEKFFILLMVLDESTLGVNLLGCATVVTFTTLIRAAVHYGHHAVRIVCVQASGAVAGFTLDARFTPCADQARQTVLVQTGIVLVAGGVTCATGIGLFLALMIRHPVRIIPHNGIREVVLSTVGDRTFFTGDDIPVLVDETGFPVVSTDDVGNVIPGVALGDLEHFGEGVHRRLTVHDPVQFVGMP